MQVERLPLASSVPNGPHVAWSLILCRAISDVLDQAANARGNRAQEHIDGAIERLADLPRRVLADRREKGSGPRIVARCARIERGQPLIDETDGQASPAQAARARRLSDDQRLAARVQSMLSKGSITRAARALDEAPLADPRDPEVRAALRDKHPEAPPPPEIESDVPALQIDETVLEQALNLWRLKPGSAAGLTGLTPEHIIAAADASAETRLAILGFINLLLSGEMPRHSSLLDAALIGVIKPAGGVRPIAICEVWLRLAGTCALLTLGEQGEKLLQDGQFGVGISGGCDAAVHAVRTALAKDPEAAALSMDIDNAFQTGGRGAILQACKEHAPQLLPFARSGPTGSLVRVSDGEVGAAFAWAPKRPQPLTPQHHCTPTSAHTASNTPGQSYSKSSFWQSGPSRHESGHLARRRAPQSSPFISVSPAEHQATVSTTIHRHKTLLLLATQPSPALTQRETIIRTTP